MGKIIPFFIHDYGVRHDHDLKIIRIKLSLDFSVVKAFEKRINDNKNDANEMTDKIRIIFKINFKSKCLIFINYVLQRKIQWLPKQK